MADTNEPRVWGIHSRDDSFFLQQNRIGIGWKEMGYRTTVSAHGGDSGIDIIAYKDELPPRIRRERVTVRLSVTARNGAVAAVGLKNQPQHVLLDPQLPMVTDTRR